MVFECTGYRPPSPGIFAGASYGNRRLRKCGDRDWKFRMALSPVGDRLTTAPAHPIAPVAMFLTVSVFPVIVACPPRGPHVVVTVN